MNVTLNNVAQTAFSDFLFYLQGELIRRCKNTPNYSLRTFARHLHIDPTALSKLLSGRRKMTKKMVLKLAERLGMSPAQVESFTHRRALEADKVADVAQTPVYQQVVHDTFQAISNWFYFAILELTYLDEFKADHRWIAKKLGIKQIEVKIAVTTLQRLGFLEVDPATGKWLDKVPYVTSIQDDFTSAAMRAMQKQILQKAIAALEETPLPHRDQTAVTFAIDSQALNEAKQMIKEFRRSLASHLNKSKKRDAVYQLSISLFPLTKIDTTIA